MVATGRVPAPLTVAVAVVAVVATVITGQEPVFRAGVESVRVDVSVTRGNRPVTGLTAGDFEVVDNGVISPVTSVSREDVPLRLLLVLDTSASLDGPLLPTLVDAATGLVRALRPSDEVGLLTFDQSPRVVLPPSTGHKTVVDALVQLRAGGPTAWRDALFVALQLVAGGEASRPVVLLFTDGADTASWMDADGIAEAVRRSGVVVHSLGFRERPRRVGDTSANLLGWVGASRSLQRAVDAGGGRQWLAEEPRLVRQLFATALDELRARYLLTYSPAGPVTSGWHDVRVRVKRGRADVKARPGYFVPAQ